MREDEVCPRAPSPGPLTVSCLGQWQTPFCEGPYTCPGTHKQADASLTQSPPVPTRTVAVCVPSGRPRVLMLPHGRARTCCCGRRHGCVSRRERESRGVCMSVLNAEGKEEGRGTKWEGQGSWGRALQQTAAGWHRAPRSQQSPRRRFTFREGSARLPRAPPLLTLLPWSRFFRHSSPSAHGGAREWVYPCLTSGLASEERL